MDVQSFSLLSVEDFGLPPRKGIMDAPPYTLSSREVVTFLVHDAE
jgi:hypothetical protein